MKGNSSKGTGAADSYLVFPQHFCSCHSFMWDVVGRDEAICVSQDRNGSCLTSASVMPYSVCFLVLESAAAASKRTMAAFCVKEPIDMWHDACSISS